MATEFHHRAITTSRSTNNSISTEIESKLVTETSLKDVKCHIKLELDDEISIPDGKRNDNDDKNPSKDNSIMSPKERRKRYEETIIDGFAITAFKTLEDLEDEANERDLLARSKSNARNETERTATDNITNKKSVKHKSHSTNSSNPAQVTFIQDINEASASSLNSNSKDGKKKSKDKTKLKTAGHSHNPNSKDQLKRCSNKSSSSDNTTLQEAIEAKELAEKRLSILQEKFKQEQIKNRHHNISSEQCNSQNEQKSVSSVPDYYNQTIKNKTNNANTSSQPTYYTNQLPDEQRHPPSNLHQLGTQRGPPTAVIMDHDLMKDPMILSGQLQSNRQTPYSPYHVNAQVHRTSVQSGNYHHSTTTMTTMQAVHQHMPHPPSSPTSQQRLMPLTSHPHQQITQKPLHSTPPPSLSHQMQSYIPPNHLSYLYQRQSSPQVNQTTSTHTPQPPPPQTAPAPPMSAQTSQSQSQSHLTTQTPSLHHLPMAFPRPPLPGSGLVSHPPPHLMNHSSPLTQQPGTLMSPMNSISSHPSGYGCPPSVYITDTIHRQTSIIPPPVIGAPSAPHPNPISSSLTTLNPPAPVSRFSGVSQSMMPYGALNPVHPSMYYSAHPAERSFYEFARTYAGPSQLSQAGWINSFGSTTTSANPYSNLDRWHRLDSSVPRHPTAPIGPTALPDTLRAYASIANHGLFPPPYF